MKFGLFFANAGPFSVQQTFDALVRTADDAGIESIWTVEHVVVPVGYESKYPYSADGKMGVDPDTNFVDPFIALTAMAARTTTCLLYTSPSPRD